MRSLALLVWALLLSQMCSAQNSSQAPANSRSGKSEASPPSALGTRTGSPEVGSARSAQSGTDTEATMRMGYEGAVSASETDEAESVNTTNRFGYGGYGGHNSNQNNHQNAKRKLRVEFAWKSVDFVFPSKHDRHRALNSGEYDPTKIIALDVDVWEYGNKRKIFVTMPGGDGVPATLATVSNYGDSLSPLLEPYPNWHWHRKGNCESLGNVYRVAIDHSHRLWVLDTAIANSSCRPQLLTFDLKTDRLLTRFVFPPEVLKSTSLLVTPIVDQRDDRSVFVYVADVTGRGLIVYDHQDQRAWRVEHSSFYPDTKYGTYDIAGTSFTLNDGVLGMALSPLDRLKNDRTLYYHALASVKENWISTSFLRNRHNFIKGDVRNSRMFHTSEQSRPSQSAAEVMTRDGMLISGLLSEVSITCWDRETAFAGWNLHTIAMDREALQFPSGMKIRDGRLWVMTSRFQRFFTQTMNWNDVNYRILTAPVRDLLRGTSCEQRGSNGVG